MELYFSEHFDVDPDALEDYGAFDISLVSDLPLFVDPFLLFNSDNPEFQRLHEQIVKYIIYLRDRASEALDDGTIKDLYCFKEVKQNWLGFTAFGNDGAGLGMGFARALQKALAGMLRNFGEETVTDGSHLEKVTLVGAGVGQDSISDFTTNLIKGWLCSYTETFVRHHIADELCKEFAVTRAEFSYVTQSWTTRKYWLPKLRNDFVLLTPMDMLTRGDTWINQGDMVRNVTRLPSAVTDGEQRAKINRYLAARLRDARTQRERAAAAQAVIREFPELIDLYIKLKEDTGDRAQAVSAEEVARTRVAFVDAVQRAIAALQQTEFFDKPWTSYEECLVRVNYFKTWIEDQEGWRLFNPDNEAKPKKEKDLQLAFGLVWGGSELDVNREVNNGRGPVDFKASYGASNKSLIEFKLASNSSLKRNLKSQVAIYEQANGTRNSVKVIVFFTAKEEAAVNRVLKELKLDGEEAVVVIDARNDNKPSASKA